MGKSLRLALLMSAAISAVVLPPNRPPGAPSQLVPMRTLPCQQKNCQGRGQLQSQYKYTCDECSKSFYFCTICPAPLTVDEAAAHEHPKG
jgi:hypothetical protein